MAVPSFPLLWGAGALWNLTRWMTIFVGAYLVGSLLVLSMALLIRRAATR